MKRIPDLREAVLYWLPPVLYAGILYYLSSRPIPGWVPQFTASDKLVHFSAYFILGALFARAFLASRVLTAPGERRWTRGGAAGLLYGVADEIHQSFVPGRTFSLWDMAADGLGAFAGAYVVWVLARRLGLAERAP